ncbi:MAG: aminotransferase class V-fold PLP-dependent enzyme [Gemmatimonadetes bacterium]|nr:aminotransferase class V-fold PLP-dependent enzyme [Gemmatimonadota bacterium]
MTVPPRTAPLAMDGDRFRSLGHDLVDRIADFLDGLPERPVTPGEGPAAVRAQLGATRPLPENGAEPEAILDEAARWLFEHSLHNGHPRFLGYITSSAAPIGMLADLLAASVNANGGAWVLSPMASEIEAQTVRWIAELLRYPTDAGGLLVSGGNMANMVGFWAARAAAAGDAIRSQGAAHAGGDLSVLASAETHTWVHKAADLGGLGTDAVRWVETDAELRMRPDALAAALDAEARAGRRPMMVVASGGSVSTGAVDPLREIAAICRERGVWFHVDGAYGGFAAVLDDAPEDLHHLALADSVAVDPHKWLYTPLEAGCALVRDAARMRAAFAYHPPYYHFGQEALNYVDIGPQNSRGFRALKVWMGLRQAGRAGYEQMISDDCRLARRLFHEADAHPELEAHTLGLSIATFRYVPEALRAGVGEPEVEAVLNDLNRALQSRLEQAGEVFLSNAVVDGRYLLRGCIVNFRTDVDDVCAIPHIVARVGRAAYAESVSSGAG